MALLSNTAANVKHTDWARMLKTPPALLMKARATLQHKTRRGGINRLPITPSTLLIRETGQALASGDLCKSCLSVFTQSFFCHRQV